MKNLESAIQMQEIYLTKTVKEWYILIMQFEENHQKHENNLSMIKATEIFLIYKDLEDKLAQLKQDLSKLVKASTTINKAVLKQKASEQKSQMAIYEQSIESIKLKHKMTLRIFLVPKELNIHSCVCVCGSVCLWICHDNLT